MTRRPKIQRKVWVPAEADHAGPGHKLTLLSTSGDWSVKIKQTTPGMRDGILTVVDTAVVDVLEGQPLVLVEANARDAVVPWLDSFRFFIPKSIREPFLGDLREDLAVMAVRGRSRTAIRWAAISQITILVVRWAWSNVGRFRRAA
jgi:hypothetical protein